MLHFHSVAKAIYKVNNIKMWRCEDMIKAMHECIDTDMSGGDSVMMCPICGYSYTNTRSHRIGVDGDYIVSFECECERHTWDVRFHFHKGCTFITVEPTKDFHLSVNLVDRLKSDPRNQYVINELVEEVARA